MQGNTVHKKIVLLIGMLITVLGVSSSAFAEDSSNTTSLNDQINERVRENNKNNIKSIVVIDRRSKTQEAIVDESTIDAQSDNEAIAPNMPVGGDKVVYAEGDYDGEVPFVQSGRTDDLMYLSISVFLISGVLASFIIFYRKMTNSSVYEKSK